MKRIAIITKASHQDILKKNIHKDLEVKCFFSIKDMLCLKEEFMFLLTYSISEIITPELIEKFKNKCFNIHPAHPNYPGRDPQHYASYDSSEYYGAVLHRIEKKVDSGEILKVDLVKMGNDLSPLNFLKVGDDSAYKLIDIFLSEINIYGNIIKENKNYSWGLIKRKREDLKRLCYLDFNMDKEEIRRRERACNFPGYSNLWVSINENSYELNPIK